MTTLNQYIYNYPWKNIKPNLTPLAHEILNQRYLLKNSQQEIIETPLEMYIRVAKYMASQEKSPPEQIFWFNKYITGLVKQKWCVSSPGLMNSGTKLSQLSACFILEIEDNLENIFTTLKNAALIYKSGGGVGFYFGNLREQQAVIESTKGVSSGIPSWLKLYDTAVNCVAQGGKRRGAALGLLPINHPDIDYWLEAKSQENHLTNFNLSVSITDEFMEALEKDKDIALVSPLGYIVKNIPARSLWEKLCYHAWHKGEPGVFFIDRINQDHANPHLGRINCSNPCAEFVNINYSSCNLASINLERHLLNNGNQITFDWNKFRETIITVQRFLDNMIDANHLPLKELKEITQAIRPQGLGFMGLARVLKALKLGYHSEAARQWAEKMAGFLRQSAEEASHALALERGVYPAWLGSTWEKENKQMRNSCLLAIAPTGTIASLCNTSWGLEPEFAPAYMRQILGEQTFFEIDPQLLQIMQELNIDSPEMRGKILAAGSIQGFNEFPQEIKEVYVYAKDIHPTDHIKMQATIQQHVDGACSKTINLPSNASTEDVDQAFRLAYKLGVKGCTVYRDRSRERQVLHNCKIDNNCPECQI